MKHWRRQLQGISPAMRRKYFDSEGNFKDPRSREEKFEQCVWQVVKGNQRTIVKHDPVRTCLRNIYDIQLDMTGDEIRTKIMSLEAQEKYRGRGGSQRVIPESGRTKPAVLRLTGPQERAIRNYIVHS